MNSTWHLYCFALFLALALGQSNSSRAILGHKYFVRLVNNINDRDVLHFTCKSDFGDVIGPRELAPNQQWEFGFRMFFGTQFNCENWYQSSSGSPNHTVEIVAFRRDDVPSYGGVHAIWSARDTGMWLYNSHSGQYTLKASW